MASDTTEQLTTRKSRISRTRKKKPPIAIPMMAPLPKLAAPELALEVEDSVVAVPVLVLTTESMLAEPVLPARSVYASAGQKGADCPFA